jgi:hypothetical protein
MAFVFDGTVKALEGRVRTLEAGGGAAFRPQRFTSDSRPTPSVAWLDRLIIIKDTGSPAQLEWCREVEGGGYEWIVVAF